MPKIVHDGQHGSIAHGCLHFWFPKERLWDKTSAFESLLKKSGYVPVDNSRRKQIPSKEYENNRLVRKEEISCRVEWQRPDYFRLVLLGIETSLGPKWLKSYVKFALRFDQEQETTSRESKALLCEARRIEDLAPNPSQYRPV